MKKIESKIRVRIPKKAKRLLLYVGGLALVAVVYVFVFQNMQLKNQELDTTVSHLRTEQSQLLEMKNAQKEHEQDMQSMNAEIEDMLVKFPQDNMEEDALAFANSLEEKTGVEIDDVYFAGKNLVNKGENSGYVLYADPVEYNFTGGYMEMKKLAAAITGASAKKNIESIILTYDSETGKLRGTMTINQFSLNGEGQEYQPSDISGVNVGNKNPFATAE